MKKITPILAHFLFEFWLVVNCRHLSSAADTCESNGNFDHTKRKSQGCKSNSKSQNGTQKKCVKNITGRIPEMTQKVMQ